MRSMVKEVRYFLLLFLPKGRQKGKREAEGNWGTQKNKPREWGESKKERKVRGDCKETRQKVYQRTGARL